MTDMIDKLVCGYNAENVQPQRQRILAVGAALDVIKSYQGQDFAGKFSNLVDAIENKLNNVPE